MDAADGSVTVLVRALAALGRAGSTGTVHVTASGGRTASIRIERGRIAAVEGRGLEGGVLGDALGREGVPLAALAEDDEARSAPIGEYLVRSGRASRGAVQHALRRQLRVRLRDLLSWDGLGLRFVEGTASTVRDELPPMNDSLLDALRGMHGHGKGFVASEPHALSALGGDLVRDGALRPEEMAALALVSRSGSAAELDALRGSHPRVGGFLSALRRVGALVPKPGTGSYAELVSLRRELDRPGASAPSRATVRNVAGRIHPDRFHGVGDEAARALSTEMLRRLVERRPTASSARGSTTPRGRAR